MAAVVLISWGIALFEYGFQVPANKIGFKENGGPFTLIQLKVLQEVITLIVFVIFTVVFFKKETFRLNHLLNTCSLFYFQKINYSFSLKNIDNKTYKTITSGIAINCNITTKINVKKTNVIFTLLFFQL